MRPGVSGLLPGDPKQITEAHARRIRELGFTGCSVRLPQPDDIEPAALDRVRALLSDHGVRVAESGATYPALVHPDETARAAAIRQVQTAVRGAKHLDAIYFLIRSGSLNLGGNYWPHRDNHTAQTEARLVDSLRQVCRVAEDEGVTLGMECHVISPLDSPERVRRIIETVGSPALRYNADPVNFVGSFAEAYDTTSLLHRIFDTLGEFIVSAHVKDVCLGNRLVVHIDECAPGEGIFDLATFMRRYEQLRPNGYAMIEHLPDAKIPASKAALDAVLEQVGIPWNMS